MPNELHDLVVAGMAEELGDRIDHLGYAYVREGLALALHGILCNDDHDALDAMQYTPEIGGNTRYQRQADAMLTLLGHERESSETNS